MSKIILVDPQDSNEKYWWIGIVVDPADYKLFFAEMVGKDDKRKRDDKQKTSNDAEKSSDKQKSGDNDTNASKDVQNNSENASKDVQIHAENANKDMQNNIENLQTNDKNTKQKNSLVVDENNYLVCYFEDGSYSTVSKKEVVELDCNAKPYIDWIKDKSFKNSKAVKNLYKYMNDKIPAKFKWLKKKRKINGEGMIKKKVWKKRADKFFGEKQEE